MTTTHRARFTIYLPRPLQERLAAYSKATDIPMSRIVERCITDYLDQKEQPKA